MNDKIDWVQNEMTREARNKLRLMWVLEYPEGGMEFRQFLSNLICKIYANKVEKRKRVGKN